MVYRVEVKERQGVFDAVGEGIKKDILDLGINSVSEVRFIRVYYIESGLKEDKIRHIAEELLIDPVIEAYSLSAAADEGYQAIEVAYNAGVMDPAEESALKAVKDLGIEGVRRIAGAKKYLLKGDPSGQEIRAICEKLLYNKLIQHIVKGDAASYITTHSAEYRFQLNTVDLLGAGPKRLKQISKEGQLFLNLNEMKEIKKYFAKLGRNPTDCELETLAQTWSEHCGHKTFRGKILYKKDGKTTRINNLLKSTIMKVTRELNKPWCVSVFKDNAGIIKFDDNYNVCFKVETHNHPSALEPFGGANTGIGGVIRDILGTGLGAKPVLNTDVFCFGPPDTSQDNVPEGVLHPKRVAKGVVAGVRDYGNKMGIPTVNGAVLFDDAYIGNPLVYCGTAGIMPKGRSFKQTKKGDLIVVAGGRTGRDGIHGATFSSGELTSESETVSSGAVQIGNPIQEKKLLDTILKARDAGLYNAITDCGAGGLSSAVGEMGVDLGARVDLEKAPLKYKGLSYAEIWISEAQERMVLAVPKEKIEKLLEVFKSENVEATRIGEFTGTGRLELFYDKNKVCDLDMDFLHNGLPQIEKKAVSVRRTHKEPALPKDKDLTPYLFKLLSHYNICSKEWIIRQYDHEVQGGSVVKPLTGILNDGPSDAAVVRPLLDSRKGLIISCGINYRFGRIDPYWMAASCIDEALRQVISVGGSLDRVALLDNFCAGNPDKPDRLGGLVEAARGCYRAARDFGVPFVSGKDSLNNEYRVGDRSIAIPCTLLISAMAVMEDVSDAVTMSAKQAGDLIYIAGNTRDELGGSHFYDILGSLGNNVPKVNAKAAKKTMDALSRAARKKLVRAIHDCSEGGIAVCAAEMAFAGGLGMDIFLAEVPYSAQNPKYKNYDAAIMFSESNSRFLVEVPKQEQKEFERTMKGLPLGLIGCVCDNNKFNIYGLDNKVCASAKARHLKDAWQKPMRW
ncbi:MAG: phosphoribosylformylglycinamidine synthase subunit PurL [Candidatus Omnitrophica bacterium]|nr:phosphoribosylformylglycinamidine synthase subunit PurL [Candidatus Omnitrophota bacterium]